MRPQKQISPENLERVLKALDAVANLWSPDDGEGAASEQPHEEYLTVRQAAARIKYCEQTLRNMMSTGVFKRGLHYYKRRGRVLFVWSRMEQWLHEDGAASPENEELNRFAGANVLLTGDEPFYPVHRARTRKKR
ncbi:MAG TPA: hypothetical protein VMA09_23210 [Candidatus Binataceae bacterium]|nr:hypothetical protein [Candidatus Binataceae bacterium]